MVLIDKFSETNITLRAMGKNSTLPIYMKFKLYKERNTSAV